MVLRSVYFMVKFRIFIPELWDFTYQIEGDFPYVALEIENPSPIHFKLCTVIGIDSLNVSYYYV